MRVALVNEGTYHVAKGGVSTWCDQLVTELDEHEWHIVTLVGEERSAVWATAQDLVGVRAALCILAEPGPVALSRLLTDHGSFRPMLAAWAAHHTGNGALPRLSVAQAARAATACDRMMMVMDSEWPEVDLVNASSNGAAALIAMARRWRDDTPFVLTEHGVYLRERYLALTAANWEWVVRYVTMAFTRAICQLAYREAAFISPVSRFNSRWASRLGADPAKVLPIPNGADPASFPAVEGEPAEPVVSFVGRIDPLKDLHTMIDSFALVHAQLPEARLRLFGPTPPVNAAYRASLEQRIEELALAATITFEGPAASARPAIEAGQVVALSSISEGLPFTVIEAMMSGRPTVNTDVGGVAEVTGTDGVAGVVVPPRDPEAFADALLALLRDAPRRAAMGAAARERMLADFSLPVVARRYRSLYLAAHGGRAVELEEFGVERLALVNDGHADVSIDEFMTMVREFEAESERILQADPR
ncbi:MAG: GT4 family glycosyltransferase PelF [Intrasporangiaceae bacterium]|nr:GT4 family glycosyltransferase PelF [Intrasporangiaceae bacterium]